MNRSTSALTAALAPAGLAVLGLLLGGCKGFQQPGERQARGSLASIASLYRPRGQQPALPSLTTNAALGEFLTYAMLNQPQIEAAYFDWAGSVEKITVERSLPDPKLTFQAYIQNTLTSLMPGLMQDIPGRGKLNAAANMATAESNAKYFAFETSVLRTAFSVKQAYYQLWFLDHAARRISRANRAGQDYDRDFQPRGFAPAADGTTQRRAGADTRATGPARAGAN